MVLVKKSVERGTDFLRASNVTMEIVSTVMAVVKTAKSKKDSNAQEAVLQAQTSVWMQPR